MAFSTNSRLVIAAIIILVSVVTGIVEIDFRVTPAVIKPLETSNVSLQCLLTFQTQYYNQHQSYYYNGGRYMRPTNPPPTDSDVHNIAMVRIMKNFQDKWRPIVQISNIAPQLVHKLDLSIDGASGLISDDLLKRSFLLANWDIATADVFGVYRCDVVSFDSQQNAVLTTSSQITLGKELDALAILRVLKHDTDGIHDTIGLMNEDMKTSQNQTEQLKMGILTLKKESSDKQSELEETVKKQSDLLKSQGDNLQTTVDNIGREITKKIDDINEKIQIIFESGFLMLWPRGSFGLLKPKSGCPSSGLTTWNSGSRKHPTESTDRNQDAVSAEIHLQEPVLERVTGDNFVTQHFCIRPDAHSLGPAWPRGSYCINKKGDCPIMFKEGFLQWDEENDVDFQVIEGQLPDGVYNDPDITRVEYCCRQDGPADIPIYLPSSDPFYLYRYGGTCQSVHGMNVTEEFVLFDTENFENKDEFGQVHPDGKINNVRLELCYYATK